MAKQKEQEEKRTLAEIFERKKKYIAAAVVFKEIGEYQRAADVYSQAGFPEAEALAFLACDRLEDAATAYKKKGWWYKAAKLYDKIGKTEEVLSMGDACFDERWYVEAADCYRRCGNKEQELQAYLKAEWYVEAADVLLGLGKYEAAAKTYEQGHWFVEAARIYIELGEDEKAKTLVERCVNEGDKERILSQLADT